MRTQFNAARRQKGRGRARIKPAADTRLRKIFADIGTPRKKPFVPDRFQVEAVDISVRSDCLVTAPTGAGKTWIAEQRIVHMLNAGKRSWYASPLKALSNAKFMEFGKLFGPEKVGILTGDRKENPDASIIVGTTEVLRNQLYDAMHIGAILPFDFVILDEAHFLGDEERGVVWEEIIIYLPSRIPLLLLSATIGNALQIAQWIGEIRANMCEVVAEYKRPVPLFPLFFHPSGTLHPLITNPSDNKATRLDKKVSSYLKEKRPRFLAPPHRLPPFGEILKVLRKYRLLPAIFFLKSRADCDAALELCGQNTDRTLKAEPRQRRFEELTAASDHLSTHPQRRHLERLGIGSHHSGQLPAWKLVLERLMTEGLLDAIFATSTVAAGVNFPARSIVLLNSDRFNGREFVPLDATQFHQMTGRAGRRGMDKIGFAVILPGKFMDIRHVAKLMHMPPSPVDSQIRINFSMVLNLLLSHSPGQIVDLLSKSFAAFQISRKKKGTGRKLFIEQYLVHDFYRHLAFLQINGFVAADNTLTEDGLWAAQLRVDQPLLIAEGFRKNLYPDSDPALLAATISIFVNETESSDQIEAAFAPNKMIKVYRKLQKQLQPLMTRLEAEQFEIRPFFLRPMATIYAWAVGHPWERVVALSEMEPGNLVMLILRTADNLRHVQGLKSRFPEHAQCAKEALALILREPVQFEETAL
ncbi:MAG: DEAD/DEAH box helicase [Desulfobacterales bacterium]